MDPHAVKEILVGLGHSSPGVRWEYIPADSKQGTPELFLVYRPAGFQSYIAIAYEIRRSDIKVEYVVKSVARFTLVGNN